MLAEENGAATEDGDQGHKRTTVLAALVSVGLSEAVARVAQLISLAMMTRFLDPVGMGVVGTAWAAFQLAAPFIQSSPEVIGVRDIAQGTDFRTAMVDLTSARILAALIMSACCWMAAMVAYPGQVDVQLQMIMLGPLLAASACNSSWVYRGLRRFSGVSGIRVASSVATVALLALGLVAFGRPWVVVASEAIAVAITALFSVQVLIGWKDVPNMAWMIIRRIGPKCWPRVVESIPLSLGSLSVAALWSCPLLVAPNFLGGDDQGFLVAGIRLIVAISAVFFLAMNVFHPILAHNFAKNRDEGVHMVGALAVYTLVIGIPSAAILALIAPILAPLLLGKAFAGAATALALLAPTLVPNLFGAVFGMALMADGRYRTYVAISLLMGCESLVGSILAFSLVPGLNAVLVLTLVLALNAMASVIAARWFGLVDFAHLSWRHLSPASIRTFMRKG